MIYIRKGIFETNSSSSHSIVMMKTDKPLETTDKNWHVDDSGIMDFWYEDDLEFGRSPFELLTDWYGRLRYCIATYSGKQNKIDELEEICRRRVSGFKAFKFKENHYGDGLDQGYIDHQSLGLLEHALRKFNTSLEEFIFNDRYIVVIDGDEYCVFDTLIETEMFNKDSIEQIASASYDLEEMYFEENGEEQ